MPPPPKKFEFFISIHAPLTGSDGYIGLPLMQLPGFQSTLPLRGATVGASRRTSNASISIHAPLTGSDSKLRRHYYHTKISIHAPLTGSDEYPYTPPLNVPNFNPRSPYGERRVLLRWLLEPFQFQSTLPLRGATFGGANGKHIDANFNPRSPYGERPVDCAPAESASTISIHAPLTGSDRIHANTCT